MPLNWATQSTRFPSQVLDIECLKNGHFKNVKTFTFISKTQKIVDPSLHTECQNYVRDIRHKQLSYLSFLNMLLGRWKGLIVERISETKL